MAEPDAVEASPPIAPEGAGVEEAIPASRCACGFVAAPPAPFCPRCAGPMNPHHLAPFGTVLSYTILHSPPAGFSAPLSIALVELPEGVRFICHGHPDHPRSVRVGQQVRIEHVDDVYHFATLSLTERARLLWSRRRVTPQKLRSVLRTVFRLR